MGEGGGDQFAAIAGDVGRELLGDPNNRLSSKTELRWGNKGSMALDLAKGTFFEHGPDEGGGVLWLIQRETGKKGRDAIEWLREHGYHIDDRDGGDRKASRKSDRSSNRNFGPEGQDDRRDSGPPFKPVATWDYLDEEGRLLFQVVRLENGEIGKDGKPVKSYSQRRKPLPGDPPDKIKNGWVWSTKGVRLVPYKLADLIEAVVARNWVFVVEGEKAADRLIEIGIPATTNARGAGKWVPELNEFFRGANVVILPDNDPQATDKDGRLKYHEDGRPVLVGQDHANDVAAALYPIAREVRMLMLPDLPSKGDVVDWLDAGGNLDKLYDLVLTAPRWTPEPYKSRFNAIPWESMDEPGPQHEWTVKGILTRGETSVIGGASQAGKSFLIIDIGMAVARGIDWMGRKTRRGLVVYQAGEGAKGIKKRLKAYRIRQGIGLNDQVPFVLMPAQLNLFRDDDPTDAFIEEVKHWSAYYGQPAELIIIDTFAKAMTGANENDGKDVGQVLERCARISRETGAHVCLVHHMNAEGAKLRGHTSVVANLDNALIVSLTDGLSDDDGRPIRQMLVDKQKDGERGDKIRFVLAQVVIGKDEDGDDITSCVVLTPKGEGSDQPVPERSSITNSEAMLLRAIEKAVEDSGTRPPAASQLPQGLRVVEWKQAMRAYDSIAFDADEIADETDEAREKRLANRRKAIQRAGEGLMRKGIIARESPWVWKTGKPVRGYRRNAAYSPADASGETAGAAPQQNQIEIDDAGYPTEEPTLWGDE